MNYTNAYSASSIKEKIAVILNANAKQVTKRVRDRIQATSKGLDVFYSRSIEEADHISSQVLSSGYSTLMTGGGDGTIIQAINTLYQLTNRLANTSNSYGQTQKNVFSTADNSLAHGVIQPSSQAITGQIPGVGILKLGTGNALASVVGAKRYYTDMARMNQWMKDGVTPKHLTLPLMESEGGVFPFAGLGYDACMLNDYLWLKSRASNVFTQAVCKTVFGYLLSTFCMTVPRLAMRRRPLVKITTLDKATLIAPDGSVAAKYEAGETLYDGVMSMVAFSTSPYYGFDFKMFPFTNGMKDTFQLRAAWTPIYGVVGNLPSVWKGTYRSPTILDFHCKRVKIECDRAVDYQVGGEAKGVRESLEVGISKYPINLVDYSATERSLAA